ncbi:MAG TPA: hypothetical protein VNT04_09845 [Gaiellaceae bacterium]|jgi:hypothetical protein|nr:hypothetical protein [Gaiellaceae bacterium]
MPTPAVIDFGTLCDELGVLIEGPLARDDSSRARLERTLTDGYAQALALEAERLKLERKLGRVAAQVSNADAKTDELSDLSVRLSRASGDLKHLRALLVAARRRVSAAA